MQNNKYNNTKIYKLQDQIYGYFYIGSTTDMLSKRLYGHKSSSKQYPKTKVYNVFNEIGWENVKIVLIEEHYLENREQQLREEDKIIQMYIHDEKCLNSVRPWVSIEEQKEKRKEYYKGYSTQNEDKIILKNKLYIEQNKERIQKYKHEYDILNKENNSKKWKEYKEKHREKISEKDKKYYKIEYTCLCGAVGHLTHKARHEKSKKHQAWLTDQQQTAETI